MIDQPQMQPSFEEALQEIPEKLEKRRGQPPNKSRDENHRAEEIEEEEKKHEEERSENRSRLNQTQMEELAIQIAEELYECEIYDEFEHIFRDIFNR